MGETKMIFDGAELQSFIIKPYCLQAQSQQQPEAASVPPPTSSFTSTSQQQSKPFPGGSFFDRSKQPFTAYSQPYQQKDRREVQQGQQQRQQQQQQERDAMTTKNGGRGGGERGAAETKMNWRDVSEGGGRLILMSNFIRSA